ncbi:unnamed protein product [Rotaria sordida]|uniref:Uncharacterized protein n=1 Tax=Rotaria sordida TaxID=392033 RepID=A0A814D081_9BILA|nr:unnamed protein product [Rotaria sordida]CAF3843195.1 unnamed protein product [Rotaria sordida]
MKQIKQTSTFNKSSNISTKRFRTATTTGIITTTETPGTPKSTSTFPVRQAVDECADICYPDSVPSGTSLSDCTVTFTGYKAGIWYAVAIQVEDFIDSTSMIPMSSVPIQFLIYVQSQPVCSTEPIIIPPDRCLEVQVGISISFNLSAMNLCNPSVATLTDIVVSSGITSMTHGNLTQSSTNSSIYYMTFTWTPQTNQSFMIVTENLQSDQYCVTFTVKNSSDTCVTTTTSMSTTTSTTTTSTTTSSTTTTITIASSTTSTTSTISITTSLSQISNSESLNYLSLVLGLGLGLGIPLMFFLGAVAITLPDELKL